jgi:hypothetical protein
MSLLNIEKKPHSWRELPFSQYNSMTVKTLELNSTGAIFNEQWTVLPSN